MSNYEDACEARDAAVHNARAGNVDQAIKHAVMATMFLMFDAAELGEQYEADRARSGRIPGAVG